MCVSPSTQMEPKKRNSTGFSSSSPHQLFPGKLHDLMTYVERNYLEAAISWVCDGRAILVNDPETLVDLLPIFFGQTKYRSFQRQLNLWHFEKVLDGPTRGAFRHPYFLKGKKELCSHMSRGHHKNAPSTEKMFGHTTPSDISISDNLGNSNDASHFEDGDPLNFGGRQFYYVDARKSSYLPLSLSDDPDGRIQTSKKEERRPPA
jgi:hypothetical protein